MYIELTIAVIALLVFYFGMRKILNRPAPIELLQPLPVERDAEGYWVHPGIPDFDEDGKAYYAWLKEQGLMTTYATLDGEDESHPAYMRYYPDDPMAEPDQNISDWNPEPPDGEGWFTLSIHDTEDGPFYVWARRP